MVSDSNSMNSAGVREGDTQWLADVRLMARRLALLYHHTAGVLVERFGEEAALDVLEEVIRRYGTDIGQAVRREVDRRGLPPTSESYATVSDLPSRGWEREKVVLPGGEKRSRVLYCPLAAAWQELGTGRLARVYCYVDQAKYRAYNPNLRCVHCKNVLDGDPFCELLIVDCQA